LGPKKTGAGRGEPGPFSSNRARA